MNPFRICGVSLQPEKGAENHYGFLSVVSFTHVAYYPLAIHGPREGNMDTERNLLLGALAFQAGLIDADQFVEVCQLWSAYKTSPLVMVLIERGWIQPLDAANLEYLLERRLDKCGGNVTASLASVSDEVKRHLAALEDDDIQRTLTTLASPKGCDSTLTAVLSAERSQRYTLTRIHSSGGMGRIWVAHDGELGREIALKELAPEKSDSTELRRRFLNEARITGQLEHPGIVPVYDLARRPENQQPFYTMRFVKGRTLTVAAREYHQRRMAGNADSLDFLTLMNAFVTVCNTIAYAHSRGVIHRDLKGQNVILGDFGEVVVLDWGLAKLVDRLEEQEDKRSIVSERSKSADPDITLQGEAIGTPAYMAPEQAAGRLNLIDSRSDVYGLGAILYEILTGHPPFFGSDVLETLRRVQEEAPIPPKQVWSEVPQLLESACLRALAKNTTERHASATELAKEVQGWQEVQRRHAEEERDRVFALSLDLLCTAGFDGYFKRVNRAFERVLGYTKGELLAQPWVSFIHSDDRESTITEAQKLAEGCETLFFENRYRCKDGSYRWLQWSAIPDFDQQLIYAAARDITERKRALEALQESEGRYRSVIAAMRDGIALLDSKGAIQACNASAERILGLSADQMMGRTDRDARWGAIHEDGTPFPDEELPSIVTLRTGKPCFNVIMGVRKPDGDLRWISINSQPLFEADEKTVSGVVASFSDITDRKQTEEAFRKTSARLTNANRRLRQRLRAASHTSDDQRH
jgi:serine/threonine-protein kinase